MDEKHITSKITQLIAESAKRKFSQSIELSLTLKEIDLKKVENQRDFYVVLPHPPKIRKVCALVGPELKDEANDACDKAILVDEFDKYAGDPKAAKKLAEEYDYFIAQATIMPKVASTFGKVFGPRGKMPNPKAGCVVPPKTQLKPLHTKLQRLSRIAIKKSPVVHVLIGKENQSPEHLSQNIKTVYDAIWHQLPNEEGNVRSAYIKLTMSKPVMLK